MPYSALPNQKYSTTQPQKHTQSVLVDTKGLSYQPHQCRRELKTKQLNHDA